MKKLVSCCLLFVFFSCNAQKKDRELDIAIEFLMYLKVKDYKAIKDQIHYIGYNEDYFRNHVNVAAFVLNKYPIPKKNEIQSRYDERLESVEYSFFFHIPKSKKDPVKMARIDIMVNKNPIIDKPITMMYVEYIDMGDPNKKEK